MMTTRTALGVALSLALGACTIEVDGDGSGLSAGMSGPASSQGTAGSAGSSATTADDDDSSGGATTGDTDPGTSTPGDATATDTGSDPDGSTGLPGSTGADDATTMSGSTGDDLPGDPLDPGLDIPEGGQPCTTPGSLGECPAIEVCRFATTEQGLCESCDVCGNLGAPCVEGTDCDILFACYQGECTNICPLGTFYCGAVEDCLDVGHPTHGVCAPF